MDSRNLSLRAAADEIRCDHTKLARICNGRMNPTTEVYLRIQAWLAKHEPSPKRATKVRRDK
jgi:plasmid maintenance system antidote protein VapI